MANTARALSEVVSSSVPTEDERLMAKLQEFAKNLLKNIEATGIAIAWRQSELGALICVASAGKKAPPTGAYVDPNSGISGRCVRECRTQKSYDTLIDPRVDPLVCKKLRIRSVAVVPFLSRSQCIGLIEAFSDRPGHFDPATVQMIEDAAISARLLLERGGDESSGAHASIAAPAPAFPNGNRMPRDLVKAAGR